MLPLSLFKLESWFIFTDTADILLRCVQSQALYRLQNSCRKTEEVRLTNLCVSL